MFPSRIVDDIDKELPDGTFARPGGSLLLMMGLPGAGKSYLVDRLTRFVPCVVVATDQVRLFVRDQPLYTPAEMAYTYEVCYGLVGARLARGQRVVFDGSNYLADRRRRLMAIARRHDAPTAVCHVQASASVTRERLARRANGQRHPSDRSDAGWPVYQWMVEAQEPVTGAHLTLDTTATPPDVLARQLWEYWISREAEFERNPDLQSAGGSGGHGHDY